MRSCCWRCRIMSVMSFVSECWLHRSKSTSVWWVCECLCIIVLFICFNHLKVQNLNHRLHMQWSHRNTWNNPDLLTQASKMGACVCVCYHGNNVNHQCNQCKRNFKHNFTTFIIVHYMMMMMICFISLALLWIVIIFLWWWKNIIKNMYFRLLGNRYKNIKTDHADAPVCTISNNIKLLLLRRDDEREERRVEGRSLTGGHREEMMKVTLSRFLSVGEESRSRSWPSTPSDTSTDLF